MGRRFGEPLAGLGGTDQQMMIADTVLVNGIKRTAA
jgi:hypothetical protein